MTKKILPIANLAGFLFGTVIIASSTGCGTEGSGQVTVYQDRPTVQGYATVSFQDDYDYYPGYETYYSRNRHEYVYRDGNTWVRRSEPRGVSVSVLLAAPSIRLDFHDSPEQHHGTVVQSYPRNWHRPSVQVQAAVEFEDDYVYYPEYETYYSRNRHEYVYRDGNSWVRRSEPRGVAVNVLLAAPSVQLDFRDSPELHHGTVAQSYPRNWKRQDNKPDDKAVRQEDKKDGKDDDKDDDKDDRKDDRR